MARALGGVARDGRVVGWSVPTFGGYHLSPNRTVLSAGANVVQVAGSSTTYFLHSDGTIAVWGADAYGEFGDGTHTNAPVFVRWTTNEVSATCSRTAISGVVTIGAGVNIGYAVKADGTTWTIASAPGTSGSGAGVQALDTVGKVWRYDRPTDSFTRVYGLTGVIASGSVGQIG